MKFDEAVVRVSELRRKGADAWFGDQLDERKTIKGHIEAADVEEIIYKLRQEYAPTVEMTEKQYHSFRLWKYHTPGWNMTNAAEFARDENMKATDAMTAWLHPETIKVVEE